MLVKLFSWLPFLLTKTPRVRISNAKRRWTTGPPQLLKALGLMFFAGGKKPEQIDMILQEMGILQGRDSLILEWKGIDIGIDDFQKE